MHVKDEASVVHSEAQNETQDLEQKCTKNIEPSHLNSKMTSYGFEYGPAFQLLTNLKIDDNVGSWRCEAFCIEYAGPSTISGAICHSSSNIGLSASAQLCSLDSKGKERVPTMIPRSIDQLWISPANFPSLEDGCLRAFFFWPLRPDRKSNCRLPS